MVKRIRQLLRNIYRKMLPNSKYIEQLKTDGVAIGERCDIHKSACFGSEPWLISIGNHTRITKGVQFITHDGGLWTLREMGLVGKEDVKYGTIKIGDNCNISWNVIIMPNVKIGNNVVVAAGAVVTKDIPDNSVWGGIPAKPIESINEYANKVKAECVPTFSMSSDEKQIYLKKNKPELWEK